MVSPSSNSTSVCSVGSLVKLFLKVCCWPLIVLGIIIVLRLSFNSEWTQTALLPPPSDTVDVVTAVDNIDYLQGVIALANSTFFYSRTKPARFFVLVPDDEPQLGEPLQNMLRELFRHRYHLPISAIQVVGFNTTFIKGLLHFCTKPNQAHQSPLNYARFYIHDLLQPYNVQRVIYMDVDMICQRDPFHVLSALDNSPHTIGAVPQPSTYSHFFNFSLPVIADTMTPDERHFNAGFLVIDLDRWRATGVTQKILYWMDRHKRECLWFFGSQPPLLLVFYRDYEHLDPKWNVEFLGYKSLKTSIADLSGGWVLHWNGKRKPWFGLRADLQHSYLKPHPVYQRYWLRFYDIKEVDAAALRYGFSFAEQH
eukprot:TRINITY_DN16726_c0_g1_i1.p1 TRINITY_DN16726_c0_g1~~TRINITY_DN16726_c0_g1_i1.p1  ORF type:complete len:367 (+),score=62.72 TRINITY_DN16726_c0_g1_i1:110-1210(+)